MSRDERAALGEAVRRALSGGTTASGIGSDVLWERLESGGFVDVGTSPDIETSGSLRDATTVWEEVAVASATVPASETWLARHLLIGLGREPGPGQAVVHHAESLGPLDAGSRVDLDLRGVPWGRTVRQVVVVAGQQTLVADTRDCVDVAVRPGVNLAGEPRDHLRLTAATAQVLPSLTPSQRRDVELRRALSMAVRLAAVGRRVRDLTLAHVTGRQQFGMPLARQPAVQQLVANLVGEIELAETAVAASVAVASTAGPIPVLPVAAATGNACTAAGRVVRIAHQLHGALGTTEEYPLALLTARLWAWRLEAGGEHAWASRVATELKDRGVWQAVADIDMQKMGVDSGRVAL